MSGSSHKPRTALDASCDEAIGKRLLVEPVEGSGWAGKFPSRFEMELRALGEPDESGEIRGGFGQVCHSGHPLDKSFVVFKLHYQGIYNFTNAIGDYVIHIYPALPDCWKLMATRFSLDIDKTYTAAGYARISANASNNLPSA